MTSDVDYAKEHKLKELFEFLMEQVLNRKPPNPEVFVINVLKRKQNMAKTLDKKSARPASSRTSRPASATVKSSSATLRPSTAQSPGQSKLSPRSRTTNYDRPWMSSSVKPMAKSAREPLVKTAKTLDLTVSSREAHFKTAVNRKEFKPNSGEVQKITKKVTNQALLVGKRQYLENESEEIQLNFDKDFSPPQKEKIDAKTQIELQRKKKSSTNEMKLKSLTRSVPVSKKPPPTFNVAQEIPVPKEYAKVENPFDLQMEGLALTEEQKNQAKHFEGAGNAKLKMDMDAMITKLSKTTTKQKIDDYLANDLNGNYLYYYYYYYYY